MKRILLIILFSTIFILFAKSQTAENSAMTWEDFVALIVDDTDEDKEPDSELFEELYELHLHPLNLNNVTEEELKILPFLSTDDIKNILFYIENHKPIMSSGELMFILSLDRQKRLMLQLFCFAGEYVKKDYSLKKLFKYSQNELTIRTDIPFYTKGGYKDVSDSILARNPNKVYQGNRFMHSLRYTFASQNHFYAGFQMEKDPGENYIDHIAGYAMIKNIGCINTAILGNYRVSFGHGLVVNTGSSFGKAMKLSSMETIDRGITRHSSTSETGYFTGGATTLNYKNIRFSAFVSYRKTDGTFNNDSTGISSLKTDGLHRTKLEISKKNNIAVTDFGGNIHLDFNKFQLSFTATTTHFNTPLSPKYDTKSSKYRYYNPIGKNFTAGSIAYSYRTNKLIFSGETAISEKFALATLDQLQWSPNSYNTISLIYRLYQAKYNAINSRAFGENSTVHNEQGIYLGYNSSLSQKINLSAYIDAMYFPWLKYQVYGSSYGLEGLVQLSYTPTSKHNFTLRYRIKSKEKDYKYENSESNNTSSVLKFKTNQNIRLQYTFLPNDFWSLKTTINGNHITFVEKNNYGFSLSETVRYTGIKNTRIDFSATYFNTDSYDSRIYNYESSLLYTFSMNSYYYKGIRGTLLSSIKLNRNLFLTAKISTTILFDKQSIGSDLELIDANHKEDAQIQVRWKF